MNRFFVHFRSVSGTLGAIGTYGQKFSQIGRGTKTPNIRLESRRTAPLAPGQISPTNITLSISPTLRPRRTMAGFTER